MKRQVAERLAMQECRRLVLENMGLFLIAEAWDIPTIRPTRNGQGLLTEAYVLEQITQQIMGMDIEEEEAADTQHCDYQDDLLPLRQGALD